MMTATQSMTREQRKSIALEYFRRFDSGGDVLDLFADDAEVYFPKWGVAQGKEQIARLFGWVGELIREISHLREYLNVVVDEDVVVVEGGSIGRAADGTVFRVGDGAGGRFTDVFEIRNGKIERCFVYLDPDYANADAARYPTVVR
ncbi:nuclear transport factor 2 family protein [Tsukamurella ocularis]|uniref:nuclear transport factor 2 family protein n=1 Tax=Tsukamurella ocularis TaxID=1970234 RepID=UPI0039F00CE1